MFVNYEENAWPDIRQAASESYIAILPLGCTEQHGPHLPLNSDCGRPTEAVDRAAARYGVRALVLPVLPFGPAAEHVGFPGTISLSFAIWSAVVVEILENLVRDGFRRIVLVKGCGGHIGIEGPVYEFFAHKRREIPDLTVRVCPYFRWDRVGDMISKSPAFATNEVHAGGVETSMVMAANPHLVHLDRLRKPEKQLKPADPNWWIMEDLSETGATGDPGCYDVELGKAIMNELDDAFAEYLGELWSQG